VANTPCERLSEGGEAVNSNPWLRSNSQMTMRCEKPSMSASPGSNSGRILSTPSASCLAPRPLGTWLGFLYGLLTNPIGREVNIGRLRFHTNAAAQPSEASPAWEVANINLQAYFKRNLQQVKHVFWVSVVVMVAGFSC